MALTLLGCKGRLASKMARFVGISTSHFRGVFSYTEYATRHTLRASPWRGGIRPYHEGARGAPVDVWVNLVVALYFLRLALLRADRHGAHRLTANSLMGFISIESGKSRLRTANPTPYPLIGSHRVGWG